MTSLAEKLLYSTTRIEGQTTQGNSVGTGFFFYHEERLFLITNKHVVEGVVRGVFTILRGKINNGESEPMLGYGCQFMFNASNFIGHPDPDVDVAAMNLSKIFYEGGMHRGTAHFTHLDESVFPTREQIDNLISPIEEVVFIGYPNGIWDSTNILPITRKGITATPYYIDFDGQKKFLIDASVFPGSSGSPVFIHNVGTYSDRKGNINIGSRLYFLGIVAGVGIRHEQGNVEMVNIPTQQLSVTGIKQMLDLGIVFKAETIKECAAHYLEEVKKSDES